MKELQLLLKRFLAREIGLEELQNRFSSLLENDSELSAKSAAWLDAGEKDGLLSAAVCDALKSVLVTHMAATNSGQGPANSGIFDRLDFDAAIAAKPDVEDDEKPRAERANQTFVRDPGATEIGTVPDELPGTDGALQIGSIIGGRYELLSQLGSGGMGQVYLALDRLREEAQDRDPHVALKVLSEEFKAHPDSMIALQREVQRAQKLSHPNVINVHEFFRDGPHLYMTMEALEGQALDQLIQSELSGGISYEQAWPIIEGVCFALQYGHDKNIVHCDIKPGNIFVCNDGTIKVLDLGISRPMSPANAPNAEKTVFDPGTRLGSLTPAYASLEMWYQDSPDPRDDVYALACVAYVLLTGRHPFDGQSAKDAKSAGLVTAKIDSITRGQWTALVEGLAFDRADRTPSVNKFRREMDPRAVVRRNRRYAAAAAALLAVVVGSIGIRYYTLAVEDAAIDDAGRMENSSAMRVTPAERPDLTRAQQDEIDSLVRLAEINFEAANSQSNADELAYMLSLGPNSVVEFVDFALEIDPGDEAALAIRQRVFDLYIARASQMQRRGSFAPAFALTRNAEAIIPNTSTVLRLQRTICNEAPQACATP